MPGVADAFLLGGTVEQMQLLVDPVELAARQLTIEDLRLALNRTNRNTSGGEIWEAQRTYEFSGVHSGISPVVAEDDVTQ